MIGGARRHAHNHKERHFMTDERNRAIDLAFAQIEKQFGKGSIMRLGSKEAIVPISVISTGANSFDAALGVGGVPKGRVVEIFGPESSGKTTLALTIVANAQKDGGVAAYIDAQFLGVTRIERVLRIHERRQPAIFLRLGDDLQGDGRLA